MRQFGDVAVEYNSISVLVTSLSVAESFVRIRCDDCFSQTDQAIDRSRCVIDRTINDERS